MVLKKIKNSINITAGIIKQPTGVFFLFSKLFDFSKYSKLV
ncbi:hypothetical protein C723_2622 [Christiangramia flava JLT2011]|uniref:Uncharacterized protein n=1 Tax=Christiangramia flava JLT2011 TaxID=1229726 RepID=A0A1L7HZH5_9FLAO|nr:hypothetical protein GRFL_0024 [Christiangramia flava JLT2011]OSS38385.1 hypothetical protein C723_2622 [Christiangramia flava JLT2011]